MRNRTCAGVLVGACGVACAQEGTATWLWDVTTQDGDAIVEPGETATVTLSVLFEVEAGKGEVVALADTRFDTLGANNAARGGIEAWVILNDLDEFLGDTTTTDGVSLFGTQAANCFGIQMLHCSLDNPIDVIAFEWGTGDYSQYSVEYSTATDFVAVWKDLFGEQDYVEIPVEEALIAFQVIPSPPVALAILVLIAPRALGHRRGCGADC